MSAVWVPDSDPHQARRVGKTLEELGELSAVLARISLQGMQGVDPETGQTNEMRLQQETADVLAQINCNIRSFQMNQSAIDERVRWKELRMAEWEAHFAGPPSDVGAYFVSRNASGAVFVKTAEYFTAQGGFNQAWGLAWTEIAAQSIEDARDLGDKLLPPYSEQPVET
jgi:hypothetical protein